MPISISQLDGRRLLFVAAERTPRSLRTVLNAFASSRPARRPRGVRRGALPSLAARVVRAPLFASALLYYCKLQR